MKDHYPVSDIYWLLFSKICWVNYTAKMHSTPDKKFCERNQIRYPFADRNFEYFKINSVYSVYQA